ncbi:MAG: TolC family protein [Acidobacteriota bacterium]
MYLARNLAVKAERQRIEMARGVFRQARMLPNPDLNFSQEGFPFGSEDPSFWNNQEFIFWATQKIELGGKRRHRTEVAGLGIQVTEAEFENFVRIGKSQLREAFAEAYSRKRNTALLSISSSSINGSGRFTETASRREMSPGSPSCGSILRRYVS